MLRYAPSMVFRYCYSISYFHICRFQIGRNHSCSQQQQSTFSQISPIWSTLKQKNDQQLSNPRSEIIMIIKIIPHPKKSMDLCCRKNLDQLDLLPETSRKNLLKTVSQKEAGWYFIPMPFSGDPLAVSFWGSGRIQHPDHQLSNEKKPLVG